MFGDPYYKKDTACLMIEIKASGLPISYDENDHTFLMENGLSFESFGNRDVNRIRHLLLNSDGVSENEFVYGFLRRLHFEKDTELFKKHDLRYDFTYIDSQTINSECKKTSGHYHGFVPHTGIPYPEIYEVVCGKALFLLQKSENFDKVDENPKIDDVKAVIAETGQSVIIPPFYGHCSVNIGNAPLIFSNIAVVSCPVDYEGISRRHGLSYYILKDNDELVFRKNHNYPDVPDIQIIGPKENSHLGIRFGKPIYHEFIEHEEIFRYLYSPEEYVDELNEMVA